MKKTDIDSPTGIESVGNAVRAAKPVFKFNFYPL